MLTTTPRRRPREGAAPTPTTSTPPRRRGAATIAQILVVPTSSPTISSGVLLLLREAADHGGAGDDGAPLLAEHAAVLVHPVQPRGVHERERAPLFDDDRHTVRQLANDVGAADLRQRGDARGDGAAVEGPEVRAGRDGGGGEDARHRDARGPAHLDAGDREARRRGDPARPRQRRRDAPEHQDADGGPPREPCEGAGPPP